MNRFKLARPVIAVCTLLLAMPAGAQSPHTHDHSFGDAQKWAKVFDDPKRDESWTFTTTSGTVSATSAGCRIP